MSEHEDQQETAEIEQVNGELTRGLKLCHSLVDDYRTKLATTLADQADLVPANDDERADDLHLS